MLEEQSLCKTFHVFGCISKGSSVLFSSLSSNTVGIRLVDKARQASYFASPPATCTPASHL